jgi:hypothetical protein
MKNSAIADNDRPRRKEHKKKFKIRSGTESTNNRNFSSVSSYDYSDLRKGTSRGIR